MKKLLPMIITIVVFIMGILFIKSRRGKEKRYHIDTADENFNIYFLDAMDSRNKGDMTKMSEKEQVLYSLLSFELEVSNGGLCQYLSNSSRVSAPYIIHALEVVGAFEMKEALLDFCVVNNIDLREFADSKSFDLQYYENLLKQYPFDDFDGKYISIYRSEDLLFLGSKYADEKF